MWCRPDLGQQTDVLEIWNFKFVKNGAGFVYFITNISDRKEKFQQTFKVASKYSSDIQWRTKNSIVDLQESLILMIVTIEGEQERNFKD